MNSDFDVIVVGAGPGGSNAVTVAVRAGLEVAQIERFRFPRVKPCAGALTLKACHSLQLDLQPSLRREFMTFEFNAWSKRTKQFSYSTPVLKMVHRPEFDNSLVEQNLSFSNFHFFDEERVIDIVYDGIFKVRTEKRILIGKQLVGADGAYSIVNRIFRISHPKTHALAVEVLLNKDSAKLGQPLSPCFDFGVIDQGYGWVFPKDDYWSVGLYTLTKGLKDIKVRLVEYILAKGFILQDDPLKTFEASQIPLGGYRLSLPEAPIYLVGDAGGFGDAITGEGIFHALESGRLAGETLCNVLRGKQSHRSYYRRLWGSVLLHTFLSYQMSRAFYSNMDNAVKILGNPLVWRLFNYSLGPVLIK